MKTILVRLLATCTLLLLATSSGVAVNHEILYSWRLGPATPESALIQGLDGNFYGTTVAGGTASRGTVFKMSQDGTVTTLVDFSVNGAINKGSLPSAGLLQASDGNFYGTTYSGGTSAGNNSSILAGFGTVFKITPAGVLTTLVNFTNSNGANPFAGLTQGNDSNFYGTTKSGGANGYGTVFKMTPAGVLTTLIEFSGTGASNNGLHPSGNLVLGSDGNFYGTTKDGGMNGLGSIFKITPAGVLTTLVHFTGDGPANKGANPYDGLTKGSNGNFYGTTYAGGGTGKGTVFQMTPNGTLTTLVDFSAGATIGRYPQGGLVEGADGNFYGTTTDDGVYGYGIFFKVTPAGVITTLVETTAMPGTRPLTRMVLGSDGNFYGTTSAGGIGGVIQPVAQGYGTAFKMTPSGGLVILASFPGGEGVSPSAGLLQGSDGNFYGSTRIGGAYGYGTIFKITPSGVPTILVNFSDNGAVNKGSDPRATLVQASDGNFYGTTYFGSSADSGTIFKMTPAGNLTTLVSFTGLNGVKGSNPIGGLIEGNDGNLYSTTSVGGDYSSGTVFSMTRGGAVTTLVNFSDNGSSNKGHGPDAGLALGVDGNFYGTTSLGGTNDCGTAFRMTPAGVLTTLVNFGGANVGQNPEASLIQGSDGNFYGTTRHGTYNVAYGTVFKMTPAGVLTNLVNFGYSGAINPGAYPLGPLAEGSDGNFYGTTSQGGAYGNGTIFQMTPSGALTTLVNFEGSNGSSPSAGLIKGSDGNFYGTTPSGGPAGGGTFYRLVLSAAPTTGSLQVNIAPSGAVSAGAQWQVDGGLWHSSGASVPELSPGTHTVYFNSISGWTTPSNQTVTIAASQATTVTGTYVAISSLTGSLQVSIAPAGAVSAGAQWQVDGGTLQSSGATVPGLSAGSHTVDFITVSGWTTPLSQTVTVNANQTTTATGTYVVIPQTGSLQVSISPAGAVSAGAQWQVDGGALQNSGASVSGLSVGSHTVTFIPVSGWTPPVNLPVVVNANQTTTATGTYVVILPQTGSLQVSIAPAGAVSAGAQWQVDGGALQSSGATVSGLSVGSHMVAFSTVSGWTTPGGQTVTVNANQTTTVTGTYVVIPPLTGFLQVSIAPAGAVSAGAKWQVDGGVLQSSGATVTGLSLGGHTVAFSTVSGWTTPASQTVTVNANQTTTTTGTYVLIPNADLASLVPSTGNLTPTFAPATTSYTDSVAKSALRFTITPTVAQAGATVTVSAPGLNGGNPVPVPSGSASPPINLSIGANVITIIVTAPGGIPSKTYRLTVTRASTAPVTTDLTSSGKPDLIFQNTGTGQLYAWFLDGTGAPIDFATGSGILSAYYLYSGGLIGWQLAGIADVNGDGNPDLVFQNTGTGAVYAWFLDGSGAPINFSPITGIKSTGYLYSGGLLGWRLAAIADVNGDGIPDLVFQNTSTGQVYAWFLDGTGAPINLSTGSGIKSTGYLYGGGLAGWQLASISDVNGDGIADLVFQNTGTGQVYAWFLDGTGASISFSPIIGIKSTGYLYVGGLLGWRLASISDVNGDGIPDLLFQNTGTGQIYAWFLDGTGAPISFSPITGIKSTGYLYSGGLSGWQLH